MPTPPQFLFQLDDCVPSLRAALEGQPLDLKKFIRVGVATQEPSGERKPVPAPIERRRVPLSDGQQVCLWEVDSLRTLWRGDRQPPTLGDYPEAYQLEFLLLDMHALEISEIFGDRLDGEMKEIYSALRRRPEGKSLGFVHDYMWQAAALLLGTRPLSQAEFEVILARLERSCRTFEMGPVSRNYIATLRTTIGQARR